MNDPYAALATAIDRALETSAFPHEDHCGMPCDGGRHDCCTVCATAERLRQARMEIGGLATEDGDGE